MNEDSIFLQQKDGQLFIAARGGGTQDGVPACVDGQASNQARGGKLFVKCGEVLCNAIIELALDARPWQAAVE